MKEKESLNVLDELNKGACMGIDAINFIFDKVDSKELKEILDKQVCDYKKITEDIEKLYPEYSMEEPHETSVMEKVRTWYGIEIQTFLDKSDSKIAELIVKGTNMGIIEGRKLLNHKIADQQVEELVKEYVDMQENALEKLKAYL